MKALLIFVFLISTAFADPRAEAEKHLLSLATVTNLQERLDVSSKKFLGLPYGKNGPLGEGANGRYDQDPLYRFDTFDCTTFVETMIALSLSHTVDEFEQQMNRIRYENGEVGYLTRNHFPSLQWIPQNIQNGLLTEINDLVIPRTQQKVARAQVHIGGWLLKHNASQIIVPQARAEEKEVLLQELRELAPLYPAKLATLNYIEIKTLLAKPALINRIPHGSVVNLVRPNWDLTATGGTHMNVSHQGFLFRKKNVLYMRHASTTGVVTEEVFLNYLKRFANHATLKGVHLMQVN